MVRLNAAQERIVNELDRNILLLASAGTGKTNTLAYRVAHIIESKRAAGEQILCMTFTNKACREMKERIAKKVGAEAKAVEVSTFHSFCYALLQEEGKRRDDLFTDMIIYDEEDCKELLMPLKPPGMKDMDFQNLIRHIKEARSLHGFYSENSAEDYRKTIAAEYRLHRRTMTDLLGGTDTFVMADVQRSFEEEGYRLMTAYEESLQQVHGVDFTDLITGVHRLFQEEEVRRRWQKRYTYIAVDEMQDTSELECEVMKVLWEGNHVLLCGDYFQTIYEWRGSDPLRLLADYRRDFQPVTVVFYENYRANQTLFKASLAVLQGMFPDIMKEFYEETPYAVTGDIGEPIVIHGAPTEWKEGAYIFDAVRAMPKGSNIGILVRNNRRARDLSRLFASLNEKLPAEERREFMIIDEYKFFRRQEIKDITAYFKLLLNPYDSVSAKRISKRYVKGIGDARLQAIEGADTRRAGLMLTDFFDMAIFEGEPYRRLLDGIKAGRVVVFDVESTGTDVTTDEIIQIAAIRLDENGREAECFERFIAPSKSVGDSEAVHGFSDEELAAKGEDAQTVLADFLRFAEGAVIVGHNVGYDIGILTSELHRHGMNPPEFSAVYDTLDIYRRFYPNLLNHKLGYLSEYFPIDHKPTHNALDDIRATALLLMYAVTENIGPTADARRALIATYKNAFAVIAAQMATLRRKSKNERPTSLLAYIMNEMGVLEYYRRSGEMQRVEYIRDLYRMMEQLEREEPSLSGTDCLRRMLQQAALTAGEPDQRLKNADRIPIITVHQAKGSEFDHVFLANMNVGVFPSLLAVREGKEAEEKRLFYVALTRAKKSLCITYITTNHRGNEWKESPLLAYLPPELVTRC